MKNHLNFCLGLTVRDSSRPSESARDVVELGTFVVSIVSSFWTVLDSSRPSESARDVVELGTLVVSTFLSFWTDGITSRPLDPARDAEEILITMVIMDCAVLEISALGTHQGRRGTEYSSHSSLTIISCAQEIINWINSNKLLIGSVNNNRERLGIILIKIREWREKPLKSDVRRKEIVTFGSS